MYALLLRSNEHSNDNLGSPTRRAWAARGPTGPLRG